MIAAIYARKSTEQNGVADEQKSRLESRKAGDEFTTRHRNDGLRKRCECSRRAWAKCSHPWHFGFKWNGTHHRFSLDKHLAQRIDSKTEAETEAEKIRIAIREGTFGQPAPREDMTLRQLADTYLERYVQVERAATAQAFRWALNTICATRFRGRRWRARSATGGCGHRDRHDRTVPRGAAREADGRRRHQPASRSLRALFNWAVRVGLCRAEPVQAACGARREALEAEPAAVVGSTRISTRKRRCWPPAGRTCGPWSRPRSRRGCGAGRSCRCNGDQVEGDRVEGTFVTWAPRAEIVFLAAKTKTRRDRRIPISTRLRAILELRRFDPAGQPLPLDGLRVRQRDRAARQRRQARLDDGRAEGPRPTPASRDGEPDTGSRAALEAIDLHFHDLRREAGSRWLEGGVPVAHDPRLARPYVHRADEHLSRRHDPDAARRDDAIRGATDAAFATYCNGFQNRGAKAAPVGRAAGQKTQ